MRTRHRSVLLLSAIIEKRSSLVNYLRADQQLSTGGLPLNPMQREQLQAHGEAVEPEARPGNHAVLLESIVVHDLEPRKKKHRTRQPKSPVGFFPERLVVAH